MPYRIRALDDAVRRSRHDTIELGQELADARRLCGASQTEVAKALGWSASKVRRIERGQRASVAHRELACFAAVVGLRYSGRFFVGTSRLRDATQLAMINGYRQFADRRGWTCRIEQPMPISGDLRAFDLVLRRGKLSVAHEFISRLSNVQAQVRPLLQKQRDAGADCLVLVVRDTNENRRAVRAAGAALGDLFPLGTRAVLAAIRDVQGPAANGLVFWRDSMAVG